MTVCFVLTQTCLLLQLALTEHLLSQGSVLGPLDTVLSQEGQDSCSWSSQCRMGDPPWQASERVTSETGKGCWKQPRVEGERFTVVEAKCLIPTERGSRGGETRKGYDVFEQRPQWWLEIVLNQWAPLNYERMSRFSYLLGIMYVSQFPCLQKWIEMMGYHHRGSPHTSLHLVDFTPLYKHQCFYKIQAR